MKKTGLFFGSFNPIHIGHLIIAEYLLHHTDLSDIWFVISPQNPLKEKKSLLPEHHRLALVKIAIEDNPSFKAIDIEFHLPRPSFTINTLIYLEEKYPDKQFVLIMGADNLISINKWKNSQEIISNYEIYVYPRQNNINETSTDYPNIKLTQAPQIDISSSFIRNTIKSGKECKYMLQPDVYNYIREMHFYEK